LSILSDFEDRVASAVEGLFAGAFRSPVQPVEIAKALGKAMDDTRSVGVGKVYVPASYVVALSSADTEKMGAFRDTLSGELATYLVAHAQERGYHLTSKPRVDFVVHDDLRLGRFRVSPNLSDSEQAPIAPPAEEPPRAREDAALDEADQRARLLANVPSVQVFATVTVSGIHHDVILQGAKVVVGRLADCDICVKDANISRQHAAFVPDGSRWAVQDLGSTNGTYVNGERVDRIRLKDGDVVRIGVTQLTYNEPRT